MDVKDLQSEATLGERNNDGSKYASSSVTLPYSRNKSYQEVNPVSLGKVDAPTARPCAVIGPDRVLPPPVSNDTLKKSAFEAWCADNVYRHPPEYPHKMTNYNTPIRNISPRQTFQENMQRIMVPPTYNSLKGNEEYNSSIDKNVSMTKNIKPNIPIETKYCEVPYSGNSIIHEQKSVRNTDLSASNVNPVLTRSGPQGWPSHLRQSRPYGAPELYQYPDYTNCAGPRPVPMTRPHRTAHEDLSHGYPDPYCHDVRFKPYATVKDRYPQARYEFISNYPSPFHTPSAYPHKYDMQKPIPQPYAYQQVPLKYLDNRIPDPVMDGYQRPTQQSNYNLPFHNQMIHPAYGHIVGNCIQNKFPCPPEASMKSLAPNKQPNYEANKMYAEYENARSKAFPVPENYYYNEMQRPSPHIKSQVMPNYSINMHRFPPHPYYTKDASLKNYEYMSHFRNIDPSMLSQSRIPSQFSPNGITITPSDPNLSLDNPQIQGSSPEDFGYVSQSPTGSIRNTDFAGNRSTNEFYRRYDSRYGHIRPPPMMSKHEPNANENSKDKKDIDVRQFLQMWNEVDDENAEHVNKEPVTQFSHDVNKTTNQYETVKNQDQLYVLGLVNVPSEELGKYEHIQKVSKLPENIKGYNSIELLNQFEEVIESSNKNSFKSKSSTSNDITYQMTMKNSNSRLSLLPRPVSPLDVEAKISQSVIHKEVGCNFEIKPCSPKMLNVEAATPIQNLVGERVIEKVSNPLIISSPLMHSEDKLNCNLINHQEQRKSPNENVKNTSCKMSNTQFNSNDTVRTNYSLQDLESNSGICLASLPRLDNDIELNFPEVNQQFINANKGESVITTTKDLPSLSLEHIDNVNSTERDNKIGQKVAELPSVSDSETEFSKLSKYRKIKKYGPEPVEKEISFSSTQNMRTDSVIIKNPDNPKIFEQYKETFAVESSLRHSRDLSNNENFVDSVNTDKERSNILNNADIYGHTEIAIDFSLNKADNNNTTSTDNTNTTSSKVDYVENDPKLDSLKINNFTKHSEISQNDEVLKDEVKIKTLLSYTDTVLKDKQNLFKDSFDSDKKENDTSQTAIEPQLNKFDKCKNTDDIRSLKKSPSKTHNNDVNVICKIKSEDITTAKQEENKNDTVSNLTSVALSVDDFLNGRLDKESNVNISDTIPDIMEGNSDLQFAEKNNFDLPDLSVENVIPSSSHIQCALENEKEYKAERFSQESEGANIDATFTGETGLCDLIGDNEILTTQKDCVSIGTIEPYLQNAQKGKTDSKPELYSGDEEEYKTSATFDENVTDRIHQGSNINISCKDEKIYNSTETDYVKQDTQKDQKDEFFLERRDGDISGVSFKNTTDITQDKLDSNINCCRNNFDGISEKKKSKEVNLQSNITLQSQNENYHSLFNNNEKCETDKLQTVLDSKQICTRHEVSNDSNGNNNILPNIITASEDTTQTSSGLVKEYFKQINILCRENTLSELQTASMVRSTQIDDNYPNSNEKSNPSKKQSSTENSRKNTNPVLRTDENSMQPLSFEPTTATMENNVTKNTEIDKNYNENVPYPNVTGNEMEFEKNVCCTRRFRSCELKKELFSPFIQKLISLNEGDIPPSVENNINVEEANTATIYSNLFSVENFEMNHIRVVDHTVDFTYTKANEKTRNKIDSFKNSEVTSCDSDFICDSIDKDTMDESITENDADVGNGAQNVMKSFGSPIDSNLKMPMSASGSDTDLRTQIRSKECINSINKPSIECVHLEDTLTNKFITAEHPENIEISLISSLPPSPDNIDTDNITTVSNNDDLNRDDYHGDINHTENNNENREDNYHANVKDPEDNNEHRNDNYYPKGPEDNNENKDNNYHADVKDLGDNNENRDDNYHADVKHPEKNNVNRDNNYHVDVKHPEDNNVNIDDIYNADVKDPEDNNENREDKYHANVKDPEDNNENTDDNYHADVKDPENNNVNRDVIYNADVKDPEDSNEDNAQILTSINEEIITNSDINNECALNIVTLQDSSDRDIMQNKYNQNASRPCLKRSLSDSALDSFNDSNDAFYSGWRPKRLKNKICNLEPDIVFDSNSQNNRRKSISSIYNEQNVSFCILIDNNCIITEEEEEENEDQSEICFTEVSEACVTDLQESVNEYDSMLSPIPNTPQPSEKCSHDYSDTQEVEETWVDDVGCMETVVSDDVAEDITISASSSPERMNSLENDETGIFLNSDHTDKVKHIYGAKMCNDDIMFLETLYRTPQMNVNKIINRESQVSEEYVQYYNRDSLEKVLSEPNCDEDLPSDLVMLETSEVNSRNTLHDMLVDDIQNDENTNNYVLPIEKSSHMCETYNKNESNDLQNNESINFDITQDDTIHSCESSMDNVFSYNQKDEYRSYTSSTSPEVSSTTSEERNSGILLKITNYKGSRVSQINDIEQETKSISCKFTELSDYSSTQNFKTNRPLITKAAQKYIPPLEETLGDLKIRLPLPQHSLLRLKQLKLLKKEPKSNKSNTKSKPDVPKKPKPKFEDVLKSIDEIQFKMHMEKSKKLKKTIPKVVIKKNENGSHYASTTNIKPFNPDLTGRKWQPWVFLEKNHLIDKMALKNKRKAIFNHRKNTYVLADKFRKYKSIGNAKFVISQPNMHSSSIGHLKCTIRLKHTY